MENKKRGFTPLEINSTRNLVSKKIAKANESIKIFPFSCGRHRYNGDLSLTGFTLLELLTVIAIIGMLAAMIFPTLSKVKIRARTAKAVSELKTIQLALMDYYAEYSGFPTNLGKSPHNVPLISNGLEKLRDGNKKYLDTVPQDSFDSSQIYRYYSCYDNGGVGPNVGIPSGGEDLADSCIIFSVGPNRLENNATIFNSAYSDAYPPGKEEPDSDNIYLLIDPRGKEGDIRYKK